ncbi:MAG: hypothetical protein JWN01_829 [Patescibacteria group bacterium]|nr:hypothetical protein [Patescibacteria group bacterium]
MSVEHQPSAPEQNEKAQAELNEAAHERLEQLKANTETHETHPADQRAEKAREAIRKQEQAPEPAAVAEAAPKSGTTIPFFNHKLNYAQTLASVQRKLAPVSRSFSKVIHTPAIEKTSEVLEKTVARPSVTAGALWTALIVGALFYFTARRYGYNLAGSEITLSFFIGGILGLVLEGLWRSFRRKAR